MAGTDRSIRLMDQQTIGAHRLIAVMLKRDRLARQPCQKKWSQCRTREVNDVSFANQTPECERVRPPHHWEWQRPVVKISGKCFRDYRDVKLRLIVHRAGVRQAPRQRHHNCLNGTNVGREGMRIQKQFHSGNLWAELGAESTAAAAFASADTAVPRLTRATPREIASTVAST